MWKIKAIAAVAVLLLLGAAFARITDQRDAAQQEAATLRKELANQRVLVIEAAAEAPALEEAPAKEDAQKDTEPQKMHDVTPATRQDKVPADAERVKPAEALPDATLLGTFRVSYYCTCARCCGKSDGITASGRAAVPYYSVAVDPTVIPLGTTLYIDFGDSVMRQVRADDTGGNIKGNKIDICVNDHEEAQKLGICNADVYRWRDDT